MTPHPSHFLFWAKTSQVADSTAWHPLCCHLIDAAMVTQIMWDRVLTPALRSRLAAGLSVSEADARRWVIFLAGLHDIGKASPGFQCRYSDGLRRLKQVGFRFPRKPKDPGHGRISSVLLQETLTSKYRWQMQPATAVALAIGAHHGTFPVSNELDNIRGVCRFLGDQKWADARSDLIQEFEILLGGLPSNPPQAVSHPAGMILAGLVSVADWIASDETFFPFATAPASDPSQEFDLHTYRSQAEESATRALKELGWMDWTPDSSDLEFADLFPDIGKTPRPVQHRITQLPSIIEQPGIAILEVPMGEGKTEAAFYLADRWGARLGQRGAYVAMPTMATANQMFSRSVEFLQHRYPGLNLNVQLLHSHAALETAEDAVADQPPPVQPSQTWPDDQSEADAVARAGEWFTRRKRGLLAPFGVGTVDQTLLAALQTKHVFVRLFGLAGKTIIFDEVHAYDSYMSTLFERLLAWLGALGSSVVVLSATLPETRCSAFLRAYARGRDGADPDQTTLADYPRLSWLTDTAIKSEHVSISNHSRRELTIEWLDGAFSDEFNSSFPLGDFLSNQLADGGCAAVICNTVRRAQDVYQRLRPYFPDLADDGYPELDLFHARFPFENRLDRERRALVRFGKTRDADDQASGEFERVKRPHRAVLVATQVIEQSLDLDFDLMVTDLAPLDLILQRSGRLQRHERGDARPQRFRNGPIIHLIKPQIEADLPQFDPGDARVYHPHVLLRSWLALRDVAKIRIPEDVGPLIEAVYDERSADESLPAVVREFWERTREQYDDAQKADRRQAEIRWLKPPAHTEPINRLVPQPRAEDEPGFHKDLQALTRLSDPTVSIVCLYGDHENPTLDPEGRQPVPSNDLPTFDLARTLLRRSVTLSDRRIVEYLIQKEPPDNWQRSALLRQQRPIFFNADGQFETASWVLRLDPDLGIYVRGKGEE